MAAKPPQQTDDSPKLASATKSKKKLWYGVAGVCFICSLVGGFIIYKTFTSKPVSLSAKAALKSKASEDNEEHAANDDASKSTGSHDETVSDKVTDKPKDQSEPADKNESKTPQSTPAKKGIVQNSSGFGETMDIPKMEFNVGNALENRVLRLSLTLEFKNGSTQKDELVRRIAQVKDIIMTSVGAKTKIELLSEKGKERLRNDITRRINEVFERPIKNIYFSEYLVD